MQLFFRAVTILIAVGAALTAINWIIAPETAAANLGMTLLEGTGASTQIGDLSAFFLAIAVMVALAQRKGAAHWHYPAAMLVAFAALMRTVVFIAGHGPFAAEFIVPEVVMAALLLGAAHVRAGETSADGSPANPAA